MNCKLCSSFITYEVSFVDILWFKSIEEPLICDKCRAKFVYLSPNGCPQCNRQQDEHDVCFDCQRWNRQHAPLINRALLRYNDTMKQFIQAYKYQYDFTLAQVFKAEFTAFLKQAGDVVYVPIPMKSTQRQFNQVTALINQNKLKLVEVLVVKPTVFDQKQAQRNRQQRLTSEQPFCVNPHLVAAIKAKKIVLIDDIYTTGTTLHHAVAVLRQYTTAEIVSYTLCR
ncbi:hypothetical protein WGH24286_00689 [Periweissella ghanensis]|uniref:Phosphoribosyltransferase domain-containing protein n=2 Tax=Periweissella ghanensis TaxID=467997 RepID=A0ABM8ZAA2_9LACO|nr:hypothetical protein WGH24286_00689 [Periweissella ghanensis]